MTGEGGCTDNDTNPTRLIGPEPYQAGWSKTLPGWVVQNHSRLGGPRPFQAGWSRVSGTELKAN